MEPSMSEQLQGRRVLVTGAASGIGAAIAARLAAAGAIVAGLDLAPCSGLAHAVVADLASDTSVAAALAAVEASMGMPDMVVHAAAMQVQGGCLDTDPALF